MQTTTLGMVLCVFGIGGLGTDAWAQGADPLGGPSVVETSGKRTLVHRTYEGSLRPIEGPAPLAALELLDLSEAARADVDDVLAERARIVDDIVARHTRLLGASIQLLQGEGDRAEKMDAYRSLNDILEPLRERPALREEIAGVLPVDLVAEFDRIIDEYEEVVGAEPARPGAMSRSRGASRGRAGGAIQQRLETNRLLFAEVKDSIERVVITQARDFQDRVASLNVDDETKGTIQAVVQKRFGEMMPGEERSADRSETFREIFSQLDAEQRRALISEMMRARRDE